MAKKKVSLIEYELKFLEKKLKELKKYIEGNPFSELEDRIIYRETKSGSVPVCLANKEAQRKDLTQALKDYAEILKEVDRMREKEVARKEARGSYDIPERMKKWK